MVISTSENSTLYIETAMGIVPIEVEFLDIGQEHVFIEIKGDHFKVYERYFGAERELETQLFAPPKMNVVFYPGMKAMLAYEDAGLWHARLNIWGSRPARVTAGLPKRWSCEHDGCADDDEYGHEG